MQAPCKIIYLELSQPLGDLGLPEGYQSILVFFCWQGLPLGDLSFAEALRDREFNSAELPINASQLFNLALEAIAKSVGGQLFAPAFMGKLPVAKPGLLSSIAPNFKAIVDLQSPLKQLQKQLKQSPKERISIVVCTRDRPEQLHRCLQSLTKLNPPPQEILVVDNAPTSSETREVVSQFSQVRYILEANPGLSIARNTGIARATGEIIAFTDDDVEVHSSWLAGLEKAFENPQTMAVTGLMLPAELETEAQINFQQKSGTKWEYQPLVFDSQFFQTMQSVGVPVWRVGAGANMAFRSKIFELVGNFDEILGAGAAGCSEDSEIWYRILAEGWQCRYEPTAVVFHHHRSDSDSLNRQMYQYMRGHIVALLVQFANYRHWGNLRRIFIALPQYYGKRLLRKYIKGKNNSTQTLNSEIAGCLAGIQYYLKNDNHFKSYKSN